MKSRRIFLFATLSFVLLLTGCFGGHEEQTAQYSDSGLIPEAYLPSDVAMVVSYSTRDAHEYTALQALEQAMGGEDKFSQTASDTLSSEFKDVGLDFETDLKPAFGDQFRLVYALKASSSSTADATSLAVVTLADPAKMTEVLEKLKDGEKLSYKKLTELDAYMNEEQNIYMTVSGDLLLVASTPDELLAMTTRSEEDSLWGNDEYRDSMDDIGSSYVLYGMLYPLSFGSSESIPTGLEGLSSVVGSEVMVVRAEENGLRFDAWVNADEDAAKEAGITLDAVPHKDPYLFEEIPAKGLMAYFESYGFKQSFDEAGLLSDEKVNLDQINEVSRNYFGMDFDEILSFMDKGYAVVLSQSEDNIVPGLTFYFDVSSDTEKATEFINKLDGQLTGVLVMLQQLLPDAVSKDTVEWGDASFARLKISLSALPQSEEAPLPEKIQTSTLQIVYGIQDDRLIISTASDWDTAGASLSESDLYKALSAESGDESEGLVLLNFQEISSYASSIQSLQSELDPERQQEAQTFIDFLEGFMGLMAQSETGKYQSHFGGFLMLAN